jgi:hypothetical protein
VFGACIVLGCSFVFPKTQKNRLLIKYFSVAILLPFHFSNVLCKYLIIVIFLATFQCLFSTLAFSCFTSKKINRFWWFFLSKFDVYLPSHWGKVFKDLYFIDVSMSCLNSLWWFFFMQIVNERIQSLLWIAVKRGKNNF